MSLKIDRVQLEIIINNDQARKQIRSLEEEAKKLEREMKKLPESSAEFVQKAKRMKSIKEQLDSIRNTIGLTGMSMKELTQRQKELNMIMRNLDPRTKAYQDLNVQLQKVKGRMAELRGVAQRTGMSIGKVADGFNRYFGVIATVGASSTGLVLGFRKIIDIHNEFEESVDKLSSLTGLEGKQLDYLADRAKAFSETTTESGIVITQSANDIVNAYTKMGSQRPELLQDADALATVTEHAIILSEAAKMDLDPATAALANTMNQFNLAATESERIINSLAAGSKLGAGDIPYLSEAIEKTGTTASLMNQSIEETIGLIETVAPYYKRAEMAGNSLDKVMLKMREKQIGFTDGTFDMNQALDELRARFANGESAAKIFGVEHAKMAEILVKNQPEFNRYTEGVTGTNIALEQAAINTDNNNSKMAQAQNKFKNLAIELGEKLAPAMTFSINGFRKLVESIVKYGDEITFVAKGLGIVASAMAAYTIATNANTQGTKLNTLITKTAAVTQKAWTVATELATGKIKIATIITNIFNKTLKQNPLGWLMGLVFAAAAAFALFGKRLNAVSEAQKRFAKTQSEIADRLNEEQAALDLVKEKLKNTNEGTEQRADLIKEINEKYGSYLPNLVTEQSTTAEIAKALDLVNAGLEQKISYEIYMEKFKDSRRRELDAIQARAKLIQAQNELTEKGMSLDGDLRRAGLQTYAKIEKEIKAARIEKEMYLDLISKEKDILSEKPKPTAGAEEVVTTGEGDAETEEQKKERERKAKDASNKLAEERKRALEQALKDMEAYNNALAQMRDQDFENQLSANERELLAIDQKYERIYELAFKSNQDITELQQQHAAELAAIQQEQRDRDLLAREEFASQLSNMDALEWEQKVFSIEEKYTKLLDQAEQYGLDTAMIYRMQGTELQLILDEQEAKRLSDAQALSDKQIAIDQRMYEAKKKLATSFGDLAQSLSDLFAKEGEENAGFQKAMAVFQTSMNIAVAISEMIAAGSRVGVTPIEKTAAIIAGIASVLSNLAAMNKFLATPIPTKDSVAQAAMGRYDVIGEQDGKKYSGVEYLGNAKTGIPGRPVLVNETGNELIIDPATTRNLQMNYPYVIEAIRSARVPQRASGSYQAIQSGSVQNSSRDDSELVNALNSFTTIMDSIQKKGLAVSYTSIVEANQDMDKIYKDVNA